MQSRCISHLLIWTAVATASVVAAEQPLAVDFGRSHVEVVVKATVDSFVGHLSTYHPTITIDDADRITAARLAFRFQDLSTGKPKRDREMHHWQQTDAHPDGLFVLTSLAPDHAPTGTAVGQLTLHGVTRELRFPVSIVHDGRQYAIDGDAPIDTREFGLPVIRKLALLKVDPIVHVRFHLQGTRPAPLDGQP